MYMNSDVAYNNKYCKTFHPNVICENKLTKYCREILLCYIIVNLKTKMSQIKYLPFIGTIEYFRIDSNEKCPQHQLSYGSWWSCSAVSCIDFRNELHLVLAYI